MPLSSPPAVVPPGRSDGPAQVPRPLSTVTLAGVEFALTAVELAWILAPLWAASATLGVRLVGARPLLALAGALWLASFLRLVDALGPAVVVIQARQQKATIPSA